MNLIKLSVFFFFLYTISYSQERVIHHYPKDGTLVIDSTYSSIKHIYHFYPSQTWNTVYHTLDVSILGKFTESLVITSFDGKDSTTRGWFDFLTMNRKYGNFTNYINKSREIKEGIMKIEIIQDTFIVYQYRVYIEMIKD